MEENLRKHKRGRKKLKIATCRTLGLPTTKMCECCRKRYSRKSGKICFRISGKLFVIAYAIKYANNAFPIMQTKMLLNQRHRHFHLRNCALE